MNKRLLTFAGLALLLIQLVVQVRLANLDSATTDEPVHIAAGYSYFKKGDFRYNPEHPPLVKELAALPLLFLPLNQPANEAALWQKSANFFYDSWVENRQYGSELLFSAGNNPDQIVFLARLPIVLLTFLLGLAIWLIVRKHWGSAAALIATAFYVSNPIVNGHGHLVTTDIAISLGYLLTAYTAWLFYDKHSWRHTIYLALALGFSLLAKHTAIILLPGLVLVFGLIWLREKRLQTFWQLLKSGLVIIGIVLVMIWAAFGFRGRSLPETNSVSGDIAAAQGVTKQAGRGDPYSNPVVDAQYSKIRPFLSLLPADYLKGVSLVIGHTQNGHSAYFLGESSKNGWWYYFPLLILLKTPVPILLAFVLAIGVCLKYRHNRLVGLLLAAALLFLLLAMSSKANLGLRHVLPIFPLLTVLVGYAFSQSQLLRRPLGVLMVLGLIVYGVSFPNYLGYFNKLAGPKTTNYQLATDSNIDWGQDLKRIANYIEETGLKKPYVVYNWLGPHALDHYLGRNYQTINNRQNPASGTIIVNVSELVEPRFSYLQNCAKPTWITSAVLACHLQ